MPATTRSSAKSKPDTKSPLSRPKKAQATKKPPVVEEVKSKKADEGSTKVKGKRKAEEEAEETAKMHPVKVAKSSKPRSATKVSEKQPALVKEKAASKSKKKKAPTPSPELSEAEDGDNDGDDGVKEDDDKHADAQEADEEADEDAVASGAEGSESEVLLHGFSSESEDSSDEEDGVDDAPVDVGKLPTVAKDDATVKLKLERAKRQATGDRGVLYLGRVPHGFYEEQMKGYFSQFGDVTRLRLSRNKKTGKSKHYGFIEYSSSAVAEIVAETMDNYLLCGHILRCKLVPKEEVHPKLWIGANRKFRRVPRERVERLQQNKERTDEEKAKVEKRLLKRQEAKKRKLKEAGIEYDFESVGYGGTVPAAKQSKRTKKST